MTLVADFNSSVNVPFQRMRQQWLDSGALKEGVVGAADFAVVQRGAGANQSVDVGAGTAWVQVDTGTRNGMGHVTNDAVANVMVTASNATNPRIDQILLRWNDSSIPTGSGNAPTLEVLTGTATGGATLDNRTGAAALPNDCLRLADILVPALSTSVVTANIRDRRTGAQTIGSAGKSITPGVENTSATSYAIGNLATPDRVQNIVLPADGLIAVVYQAIWANTVGSNARATIFVGANQLKVGIGTGAPTAIAATGPAQANDDGLLTTSGGSAGLITGDGVGNTTEVTTGQMVGGSGVASNGSVVYIFAAAGTYDISVQFLNTAAGTTAVRNRHLWVWTMGF